MEPTEKALTSPDVDVSQEEEEAVAALHGGDDHDDGADEGSSNTISSGGGEEVPPIRTTSAWSAEDSTSAGMALLFFFDGFAVGALFLRRESLCFSGVGSTRAGSGSPPPACLHPPLAHRYTAHPRSLPRGGPRRSLAWCVDRAVVVCGHGDGGHGAQDVWLMVKRCRLSCASCRRWSGCTWTRTVCALYRPCLASSRIWWYVVTTALYPSNRYIF